MDFFVHCGVMMIDTLAFLETSDVVSAYHITANMACRGRVHSHSDNVLRNSCHDLIDFYVVLSYYVLYDKARCAGC